MTWKAWATGLAASAALCACTTTEDARARLVKVPPPCQDQTAEIYFDADSAELTAEGQAVIRQAATAAAGCAVERVEVLGLADAAGAPEPNLELSKRRAQAVTAALATAGLPAAEFRVAAAGSAGAIAANGEARPLRRRADIVLHLKRPK